MPRTLSAIFETIRGLRKRIPRPCPPIGEMTLFITDEGERLALSIALPGGIAVTVLHDGSTAVPDGVSEHHVRCALEHARTALVAMRMNPWF